MTTTPIRNLTTGDLVLDAFTLPDGATCARLGVRGVTGYVCQDNPLTLRKQLNAAKIADLHAHGIGIVPNYEWYAARVLEGYKAGWTDAGVAAADCEALGIPWRQTSIYVSYDIDVNVANLAAVLAYADGWHDHLGKLRAYGDRDIIEMAYDSGLLLEGNWYAAAQSWSGRGYVPEYPLFALRQWVGHAVAPQLEGMSVDANTVLGPVPFWFGDGNTVVTPTPVDPSVPTTPILEDEMLTIHIVRIVNEDRTVAANAQFVSLPSIGTRYIQAVIWATDEPDLARIVDDLKANNANIRYTELTWSELKSVALIGARPVGDALHEWSVELSEFQNERGAA